MMHSERRSCPKQYIAPNNQPGASQISLAPPPLSSSPSDLADEDLHMAKMRPSLMEDMHAGAVFSQLAANTFRYLAISGFSCCPTCPRP